MSCLKQTHHNLKKDINNLCNFNIKLYYEQASGNFDSFHSILIINPKYNTLQKEPLVLNTTLMNSKRLINMVYIYLKIFYY